MDTMLSSTQSHTHHIPSFFCLFIMILQLYLNNIIDFFHFSFEVMFLFPPSSFAIYIFLTERKIKRKNGRRNFFAFFMSSQKFLYKNYGYLHSINITLVVGCLVICRNKEEKVNRTPEGNRRVARIQSLFATHTFSHT